MQLITKETEKGFIELLLLSFLAIILIQINSIWTLSKIKLNQEKISSEVLKDDYNNKLKINNLLIADPHLNSVQPLSAGFKSTLKSPFSNSTFLIPDKNPSLNWLYYDSLKLLALTCKPSLLSLCNIDNYSIASSRISPFTETDIRELNIIPKQNQLVVISLGNLTIENLGLNPSSLPKFTYVLISSYNNIKIDKITGTLGTGIKLLFYSIIGEVSITDIGINRPCDSSGAGNLIFISPLVKISNKKRSDLRFPSKTCLKDFPNQIFTTIKIASIH